MPAMFTFSAFVLSIAIAPTVAAQSAPPPSIQNGRVVTRSSGTIESAVRAVSAGDDAAWVAWKVPMIDGQGSVCSTWTTDGDVVRGEMLDQSGTDGRPRVSPPTGPVQLEAGTQLIVLMRVVNGRVERIRSVTDDCPVDANGRTVDWLATIGTDESVRYLTALADPATVTTETRRVAQSAVTALAWHKDVGVTARLVERLADTDTSLRLTTARALASYRGSAGVTAVISAATAESDAGVRQMLVQAIGRSTDPAAAPALLRFARTDAAGPVRGEAVAAYTRVAGAAQIPQVIELITAESSPDVQRRALSAISHLPQHAGVPALLTLARSTAVPGLRKEAVRALSTSDDPRARSYMEQLVKE